MSSTEQAPDNDVLIIGAGLSGIFSLYRMRGLGFKARVLEAGSAEGGTWYWNRYPGCRFDSESYTYHFTFSQEVLDEWDWTEHFAPQAETLKYAQFLADKFDLRRDMQFETTVKSAHWQDQSRLWLLTDAAGKQYTSRFLITAVGILSEHTLPNIPGVRDFQGEAFHTSRWPSEWSVDGKRVGIIGTGATAIQIIPELVKLPLQNLTVFQRTANWSAPLRNEKISPEEMNELRKQYPEIHKKCNESGAGFQYSLDRRKTFDVPEEERLAFWESLYAQRGFAKWLGSFADHLTDPAANKAFSEFHANKIRQRVKDPVVAEKLIPKTHGFGTRRVPLETHYLEAYNYSNVRLVDSTVDSPIERITNKGVLLANGEEIELDILIYATGFDAITGSLTRGINIRGINGVSLNEKWEDDVETFLGLMVKDFPNMAMIMGPHQVAGNIPRSIEFAVDSVTNLLGHCKDKEITFFEAKDDGVKTWMEHVHEVTKGLLTMQVDSWATGVNSNVKGRQRRRVIRYFGPGPKYRKIVNEVAERQWADLELIK
ncbi:uncharacterized protein MYCGRDRAFT_31519 [Zymoseptoria tritici IPO323]|uniref:Cyclohexanone monooxygenase n=1 Tax=Zymoseptoria tritici (strain CBS 115943 / IPO323) TaxID=336722 RepID=F9WYD3_ZYMTI|nr:uncharacterized protein MYCGRDRAFT_31519 [Zymoseptoria tritici IPO323]EGP92026.1 hypothetical protein MYCGRDRAFT_31519 [Zymoseptoria tritici IPO323]